MILSTLSRGYTLSTLWAWFIVPTFEVSLLTLSQACGLGLLTTYMTYRYVHVPNDERSYEEKMVLGILCSFLMPAMFLGAGYIVRLFMPGQLLGNFHIQFFG